MLEKGLTFEVTTQVSEELTAAALGSGDLMVYATPAMVALMENAAMMAVAEYIGESNTTVGAKISCSHIKASAMGESITAKATLVEVEGRKLSFKLEARDSGAVIGEGDHVRYIVDREKFMAKL